MWSLPEKKVSFDKWLAATNVFDKDSLRELILLEDFKNCLLDTAAVFLNERKVTMLS